MPKKNTEKKANNKHLKIYKMKKEYGVQNIQTGLLEDLFDSKLKSIELCNKLNNGASSRNSEFKTVYVVDGKIYDSEREYINS